MDSSALLFGNVIGARYRVEAMIGEGGMAVVYRAVHTSTGKPCALKLIRSHLVSRPELLEMFVREAQIAGKIGEHPNIVNVFDAGIDEGRKIPFIAMELLQGQTLEKYVEANGYLPRSLFRTIFEQLADALDQAHRAGVIHRDLKPGNLFLTVDRRGSPVLKVMDFGIAKVLEQGVALTATRIGSPAYAAPEQQSGSAFRRLAAGQGITIAQSVSPATDVWAVGLIAYELITGLTNGHYWMASEEPNDLLMKIALEATVAPSDRAGDRAGLLPAGFDEWFERCMRKNAAERFAGAGEAIGELLQLLPPVDGDMVTTRRMPSERQSSGDGFPPAKAVADELLDSNGPTLRRDRSKVPPLPPEGNERSSAPPAALPPPREEASPPLMGAAGNLRKSAPPPGQTNAAFSRTSDAADRKRILAVAAAAGAFTIVIMVGLLWLLLGRSDPSGPELAGPEASSSALGAKVRTAPSAAVAGQSPGVLEAPPDSPPRDTGARSKAGPGKAMLKLSSQPGSCRVSVDDVPKGSTPMEIEVRAGVYVVGCKTLAQSRQQAIVVKAGVDADVEFDLNP